MLLKDTLGLVDTFPAHAKEVHAALIAAAVAVEVSTKDVAPLVTFALYAGSHKADDFAREVWDEYMKERGNNTGKDDDNEVQ